MEMKEGWKLANAARFPFFLKHFGGFFFCFFPPFFSLSFLLCSYCF